MSATESPEPAVDASIAILFALVATAQLAFGDGGPGAAAQPRWALQHGEMLFQRDRRGREIYGQWQPALAAPGGLEPVVGLSLSAGGTTWIGGGLQWTGALPHGSFVQLSLMPGLYAPFDGPDLGHALEFRSSVGVGYGFANGARLSLQFDHRSNAGLSDPNPGLETFGLRLALPY